MNEQDVCPLIQKHIIKIFKVMGQMYSNQGPSKVKTISSYINMDDDNKK